MLNNELRTPAWVIGNILDPYVAGEDKIQFLGFFDYGSVYIKDFNAADLGAQKKETTTLASVGAGIRYTLHQNLSVRFDYGFQLMEREKHHTGYHVGALLSF